MLKKKTSLSRCVKKSGKHQLIAIMALAPPPKRGSCLDCRRFCFFFFSICIDCGEDGGRRVVEEGGGGTMLQISNRGCHVKGGFKLIIRHTTSGCRHHYK